MSLTSKDVAEITRILEESSFDELYLEVNGFKLTLKRTARSGISCISPIAPRRETASASNADSACMIDRMSVASTP